MASNRRAKKGDEWTEVPGYFDVVAFGKLAELAREHLRKGRAVAIDGRLAWSEYEKGGEKRQSISIIADQVRFLDKPPASDDSALLPGQSPASEPLPV